MSKDSDSSEKCGCRSLSDSYPSSTNKIKKESDEKKESKNGKPQCHSSHEQFHKKIGCDKFSTAEPDNERHHSSKALLQSREDNDIEKIYDIQYIVSQQPSQCDSSKDFLEHLNPGKTMTKYECLDLQSQCCQRAGETHFIGTTKTPFESEEASKATNEENCKHFKMSKNLYRSAFFGSMGLSKPTAKIESLYSQKQYCKSADEGKSKKESQFDCSDSRTKHLVVHLQTNSAKCAAVPQAKPSASVEEQVQDKPCSSDHHYDVTHRGSLSSACSKISNYYKNIAKLCVNIGKCDSKITLGMQQRKAIWPQAGKPSVVNYVTLDSRNKHLNGCTDKYMKLDPGKMVSKGSIFANAARDMSDECMKEVPRQVCVGAVKETLVVKTAQLSQMIGPRTRQIMGRYAPSAVMYLATTALLIVYVTE